MIIKKGMRVLFKTEKEIYENIAEVDSIGGGNFLKNNRLLYFNKRMAEYCEKICRVGYVYENTGKFELDDGSIWIFTPELVDRIIEDEINVSESDEANKMLEGMF